MFDDLRTLAMTQTQSNFLRQLLTWACFTGGRKLVNFRLLVDKKTRFTDPPEWPLSKQQPD